MAQAGPVCRAEDSVLLLIDVQQRLVDAMTEDVAQNVVLNAARLLAATKLLDIPVISTEQYPKGLGKTVDALGNLLVDPPLEKTCFSSCGANGFSSTLTNLKRTQVVIAGMESHVCVLQTALELAQSNTVFIAADACCSRSKAHHRNAMQRLQQAGVIISNHESIMFEWLRDASHAKFKTVSALIK